MRVALAGIQHRNEQMHSLKWSCFIMLDLRRLAYKRIAQCTSPVAWSLRLDAGGGKPERVCVCIFKSRLPKRCANAKHERERESSRPPTAGERSMASFRLCSNIKLIYRNIIELNIECATAESRKLMKFSKPKTDCFSLSLFLLSSREQFKTQKKKEKQLLF